MFFCICTDVEAPLHAIQAAHSSELFFMYTLLSCFLVVHFNCVIRGTCSLFGMSVSLYRVILQKSNICKPMPAHNPPSDAVSLAALHAVEVYAPCIRKTTIED